MSRDRLLVLDADMPKRLAAELGHRARRAVTAASLNLAWNVPDAGLLKALAGEFGGDGEWVLVTGDDRMPLEHASAVHDAAATIAVIHPDRPETISQHQWRIDVTQRFAHSIQIQQPRSVRRYSLHGSKLWTPRRQHLREMRKSGLVPWTPRAQEPYPESESTYPPEPPRLWDE